jgi:glycosyltransferase involved in cell wall biosynthesis
LATEHHINVLWITPGFAASNDDHNCIPPLQLLAQRLHQTNLHLHILALGYPFHHDVYHWHGIPVRAAYGWNGQQLRWLNWIRLYQYARALHRNQKFNLIHSFWLGPSWIIGRTLSNAWNVPLLTTLMGQDVLPANRYLHFLQKKHTKDLVAVSNFQNKVFEKTTRFTASHTIPWGVETFEIPAHTNLDRPIQILGCGALIPLKNWEMWLEIVAILQKTRPTLRAELIGDGPDKQRLQAYAQALNLQHCVQFSGNLPRNVVLERMQASQVLLHCSNFESFGFVLAEADMCGCQVISTPVGIAPDQYPTSMQVNSLAEMVSDALDTPKNKKPFVPYTMEQTAQAYTDLYQKKLNLI